MKNLSSAVGATSYPGRGILIGKSADATRAFLAYFIMALVIPENPYEIVD